MSLLDQDAVLCEASYGRVKPTPQYSRLLEIAGDLKPRLISIASSPNVFAGNEIDRGQVQQFVAMLRRITTAAGGGGLVLISHPSLTGKANDSGISGSTGWHNGPRARMYLKDYTPKGNGDDDDEVASDMRTLVFRKVQYGSRQQSIGLKYQNGLFLPVADMTADRVAREQKARKVYLAVAAKLIGQNQDLAANSNAPNNAPSMIAADAAAKGFTRKEMEQAQRKLLDMGKIHIADEGRPSQLRKRIRLGPGPAK
jgi:RecA-family ATPase